METNKEIVKRYTKDDLTVVWKPNTCIHAKHCWKDLIQVFNPKNRPWINLDGATEKRIIAQVEKCPSGALSYELATERGTVSHSLETKVEVLPNGPLLVYGTLEVKDTEGNVETKNKTTAFCRCGASQNKPYCDGAHMNIDFKG